MGEKLGTIEGLVVGEALGDGVGCAVGERDGEVDGEVLGAGQPAHVTKHASRTLRTAHWPKTFNALHCTESSLSTKFVSSLKRSSHVVGLSVGLWLGALVGVTDGENVGRAVVGDIVGDVGLTDGDVVGEGDSIFSWW